MSVKSDPEDLAIFVEEARELLRDCEECMLQLESTPSDAQLLHRIFRNAHTFKGTGAMLGLESMAEFAHELETLLAKLRDGLAAVDRGVVDILLAGVDVLRSYVAETAGGPAVERAHRDSVLARLRAVDDRTGGLLPESPASRFTPEPHTPGAASPRPRMPAGEESATSIRVPIEKVDRLVNLVGELVTTQSAISMLVGNYDESKLPEVREVVAQMDRYCREMQERVLGVRMLPVRTVFSRFLRVVRDLCAITGKRIELRMSGEDTELDKTVLERITDPLTHLIRNAVDHGVEAPSERAAGGKPSTAVLSLRAYQKGGRIFIEVSDDGRGLNRKRITDRAKERGLIPPDARLTDAQTDELIFLPGFSTAEHVTELSGRGVGMDVVLKNVQALKGTISISSAPGAGTSFQIKLPLTLAILDGLALRVGMQVFIAPLVTVVELVTTRARLVRTLVGGGSLVDVRGEFMPLIRAHDFFRVRGQIDASDDGILVVIDAGDRRVALLVDEVLGQCQVVQKSLEQHYRSVHGIAGATILGDGRVALILDPTALRQLNVAANQVEPDAGLQASA